MDKHSVFILAMNLIPATLQICGLVHCVDSGPSLIVVLITVLSIVSCCCLLG